MKKTFILFILCFSFLFANEDYSEMSTEELIAIMGYVKEKNNKNFIKELKERISVMTPIEKEMYEKNKEKLKNNEN